MEKIKVLFPGGEKEFELSRPVVMIGTNGAGKTRFTVEIEKLNDPDFHRNAQTHQSVQRITAQKSLFISRDLRIKGLEASQKDFFLGDNRDSATRLGYKYNNNPATHLVQDFDKLLSLFFTIDTQELQRDREAQKYPERNIDRVKETIREKAERIWNELLPHRKINLTGNAVNAEYGEEKYAGQEMSDGERVILYLIVQALVAHPQTLFIVDEPELHIHKAILKNLWDKLETVRADCVFMYVTHDLDFAFSRNINGVFWLRSYDGKAIWDYEFVNIEDYSSLSPEFFFELIGTKKKVLFVEGEKSSYDTVLYREIYPDYHVVPCGGCQKVISYVDAYRGYSTFNHIEVYGIIDRDYRSEEEINAYECDGIFALKVAEVENLFLVPEILELMDRQLGMEGRGLESASKFIKKRFEETVSAQIDGFLKKEIKHLVESFDLGDIHASVGTDVAQSLTERFSAQCSQKFFSTLLEDVRNRFNTALELRDILKVFNDKGLLKSISDSFGLKNNTPYYKRVISLMRADENFKRKMIFALRNYLPERLVLTEI